MDALAKDEGNAEAEKEIIKLNSELEQRVNQRTMQLEHANKELEDELRPLAPAPVFIPEPVPPRGSRASQTVPSRVVQPPSLPIDRHQSFAIVQKAFSSIGTHRYWTKPNSFTRYSCVLKSRGVTSSNMALSRCESALPTAGLVS